MALSSSSLGPSAVQVANNLVTITRKTALFADRNNNTINNNNLLHRISHLKQQGLALSHNLDTKHAKKQNIHKMQSKV